MVLKVFKVIFSPNMNINLVIAASVVMSLHLLTILLNHDWFHDHTVGVVMQLHVLTNNP